MSWKHHYIRQAGEAKPPHGMVRMNMDPEKFVDDLPELMHSFVYLPYFAVYNAHPCFWPKLSGKKIFQFNFLIQLFIYLCLETKLIIVFQDIILHMDVIIAF